jgi:hypothetical protein
MDFWRRAANKARKRIIMNMKIREIMNVQHKIVEILEEYY